MITDRTVVQFVCFETPLPRPEFVPGWAPCARTLFTQGVRHTILSERVAQPGAQPPFTFIARNEWPAEAFARAARAGRIGAGDDNPFHAAQGGTFWATEPVPFRAEFLQDKVMALLSVSDGDTTRLRRTIVDAFGAVPGPRLFRLFVYGDGVAERQCFDVVAEGYCARGQGLDLAAQLERDIASRIDRTASTIAAYQEILTQPLPLAL